MSRRHILTRPLEELDLVLALPRLTPPFCWPEIFGREGPVEIEIGCGKGLYLVEASLRRPWSNFVGVERAGKWFHRAAERVERSGLGNIRLVRAAAFDLLTRWVPPASLAAVHVYFPDPWPKKRHARRRLLQEPLYSLSAQALAPGQPLFLATDVEGYFQQARDEISRHPLFAPIPWPAPADEPIPTSFARKYEKEGRTLHYAKFLRLETTAGPGALDLGPLVAALRRAGSPAAETSPREAQT